MPYLYDIPSFKIDTKVINGNITESSTVSFNEDKNIKNIEEQNENQNKKDENILNVNKNENDNKININENNEEGKENVTIKEQKQLLKIFFSL